MMIWTVLALFVISLLMLVSKRFLSTAGIWLLPSIPLTLFVYFLDFIPDVMQGKINYYRLNWFPQIGVSLSFRLDGLSLLFTLLITGIGTLIIIYSIAYLKNHRYLPQYFCYLYMFMGAMLGVVLDDNLISLFIFWEVTSISSYLLIGFNHQRKVAREAALSALMITSSGALFLLVGFILTGISADTYSVSKLIAMGASFSEHAWYPVILILVLIGAFTKSAQFPFHFWLPNAMEAPTPVSAYLHSATMVQAGVYLLARFHPFMSHSTLWFTLLSTFGAITMMVSVFLAFREKDMKLILAYTTVTALGSLVFLLASDQIQVIKAAIAFLVSHALYKATLFMVVGDIQHQTGTRMINEISGLRKAMPITFMAAMVAGASMAGLPPLLGFYVKELVYEAQLAAPLASYILTIIVIFANIMVAALAFILVIKPFYGKQYPKSVREANIKMSMNAFLLSVLTLIFSIFPFIIYRAILTPAASAVLAEKVTVELSLWHGFTPSLALSVITLFGAIIIYLKRNDINKLIDLSSIIFNYGPDYFWRKLVSFTLSFAEWQTNILQSGKLRTYLTVTFLAISLSLMFTIASMHAISITSYLPAFNWQGIYLAIWIFTATISTMLAKTYLRGLVLLGMFGLGVALLYLMNAAPDVAMTQVLVETLIVIIVVLNLYKQPLLPKLAREKNITTVVNFFIAGSLGISITLLLLTILHQPFNASISEYYLKNSLALGNGKNVVNVILVDFRALDTLGEIIVVAAASVGVFALLSKRRKVKKK